MKKICLEIYVPASGTLYEMKIPRSITVAKANEMIMDFLRRNRDISFIPTADTMLCYPKSGVPLDENVYFDDLALKNGDRLLII